MILQVNFVCAEYIIISDPADDESAAFVHFVQFYVTNIDKIVKMWYCDSAALLIQYSIKVCAFTIGKSAGSSLAYFGEEICD